MAAPAPIDTLNAQESDSNILLSGLSIGSGDGGSENNFFSINRGNNGNDAPILFLAYESASTQIYRNGRDYGVKVILDKQQHPGAGALSQETIQARIEHERQITNDILPQSITKRRISRIEPFINNGCHQSFHFEWIEGIPLKDWIAKSSSNKLHRKAAGTVDWKAHLRMATAIAKIVNEYHNAGVAHTRLSTSNIIVDATTKGHFVATLIDLSRATLFDVRSGDINNFSCQNENDDDAKRIDLKDLGRVFYELFYDGDKQTNSNSIEAVEEPLFNSSNYTDIDIDTGKWVRQRKRERLVTGAGTDDGLMPMYLSSFISALMSSCSGGNEFGEMYNNVKDVLDDLKVATTNNKYDIYFPPPNEFILQSEKNQLLMQRNVFYGRKSELSMLMQTLNTVVQGSPAIVTAISGPAGMG